MKVLQKANQGFDLQKEDYITRLSHILNAISGCIIELDDIVEILGEVHLVNEVKGLSPSLRARGILLLHGCSACSARSNRMHCHKILSETIT